MDQIVTQRQHPRIVPADGGDVMGHPSSTDRFLVNDLDSDGRFSLVEHILAPGVLAAPMHRHTREDEFTFVREGRVGAILDGREVIVEAGELLFKPRGEWHTFWNAGDGTARMLEIISPAGLEELFRQIDSLSDWPDPADLEAMGNRFGVALDLEATTRLAETHDLEF